MKLCRTLLVCRFFIVAMDKTFCKGNLSHGCAASEQKTEIIESAIATVKATLKLH
jgi:hypothetical protein